MPFVVKVVNRGMSPDNGRLGAAWWALWTNLGLALAKLVGGWLFGSRALLADGLHSLGDTAGSVAVLYGLHFGSAPPDEDHPYGHERAEALASFAVGLLLLLGGASLGGDAVRRLWRPSAVGPAWPALIIAAGALLVKDVIYRGSKSRAETSGSAAYWANAADSRVDIWSSAVAMGGILAARLGFPWADAAGAVVVSLLVIGAGFQLARGNLRELLESHDPRVDTAVRAVAQQVDGVQTISELRTRMMGPFLLVDVRIGVNGDLTVRAGHEIAHRVATAVHRDVPRVREVLVHVDPVHVRGEGDGGG